MQKTNQKTHALSRGSQKNFRIRISAVINLICGCNIAAYPAYRCARAQEILRTGGSQAASCATSQIPMQDFTNNPSKQGKSENKRESRRANFSDSHAAHSTSKGNF
ncbi:MAG: hypothetical protein DBX55_05330 [Verrucomicrobia bacterium]|nr:MAG: hypothetical protein DBX55_05330 [Verrucomicrobiota bacterium]